jgi:hypothetical protein
MKALLALVVIYVGAFLIAIQSGSPDAVKAASQNGKAARAASPIDPAKESDIRSLMELVGVRDQIQDGVSASTEQFREKLLATVPNNEKGQQFIANWADNYQKNFDVDAMTDAVVKLYDEHFTADQIKVLLQFYGSPIGQKYAAEMPKLGRELQAETRSIATKAAKEALQAMKQQNPEIGQNARLNIGQQRGQGWHAQQRQATANQP